MNVKHRIVLNDAFGVPMPKQPNYFTGSYVRAENAVGALTLELPGDIPIDYFKWHGRIEIWRSINGLPEVLAEDTVWLINKISRIIKGKERFWKIEAGCLNSLLNTRIVDYNAGNSYTLKLGAADDIGKAVVRENLGSLATDTTRDLSTYLTIDGDLTAAPVIRRAFENQRIIEVLSEFAAASLQYGTYLVFDITASTPPTGFVLKTYTGYRGSDHRFPSGVAGPLLIGPDFGNFSEAEILYDYADVYTRAIISGTNVDQTFAKARQDNTTLQGQSPFGLIENQRSTNNQVADATLLTDEAKSFLDQGRAKIQASGKLVQTPNFIYGIHWGWGDFITVQIEGINYDAHASRVQVPLHSSEVDTAIQVLLRTE